MPQFASVPRDFSKSLKMMLTTKCGRKYKNIDTNLFNQDLKKIDWNTTGLYDVNQYGENFMNVFNKILDVQAPVTEIF